MKLTQHPLSAIFPAMPDVEYEELKTHISKHGQQAAIATFDGQVLDGWHRYRACKEIGLEPKLREVPKGTNLPAFVRGQNFNRRHMSAGQRAVVVASMAKWAGEGKPAPNSTGSIDPVTTNAQAAKAADVSEPTMKRAKVVVDAGRGAEVLSGKATVSGVAKDVTESRKPKPAPNGEKEVVRDSTGYAIPEKLLPLWGRRAEVKEVLDSISRARSVLRKVMEGMRDGESDILYAPANVSGASAKLNDAWTTISMAMPYAVCPICQGRTPDSCKSCKGRGFIPKHTFEHAFPPEMLAVRDKSCVK